MPKPCRYLGIDYGSKTLGTAMTDSLGVAVFPYETVFRGKESKLRSSLRRIEEIIVSNDIQSVVIGLPLNMDGTEGERSGKARVFASLLSERLDNKGISVSIFFQDERLTTVEAEEILLESGISRNVKKQYIDSVAAAVILEDFLSNKSQTEAARTGMVQVEEPHRFE